MAKFPIDLSKFQKISATDKKTTLKHQDGHFMVIAHGKLKPEMQEALKGLAFAKGGKVKDSYKEQPASKNPGSPRAGVRPADMYPENRLKQKGWVNPNPESVKTASSSPRACMRCGEALDDSESLMKCMSCRRSDDSYADGGEVAEADPQKAKEMQAGATQSGWQPSQWGKNIKEGLGMAKGGKVERAKLFGERGNPGKNSVKGKAQMQALIRAAAKRYGLEVVPSKGKIDEETGERKGFDPNQVGGKLKPDWRSGEFESQMNPQAISHEMGHLEIAEEGKKLPTLQRDMDKNFAETASEFGGRQKQTQGEIQPMAMENPLRRRAGVPAFARPQYNDPTMGKGKEPITEDSPERQALDTGEKYAQRLHDPETGEMYDLIGLSKNASPPNLERLMAVDEGSMKFGKGKGWQKASTPDALINLRGRGQGEEAASRAQSMGIQKGKKPSRLYANGTPDGGVEPEVEAISPEEQQTQSSMPQSQPEAEAIPGADPAQAAMPPAQEQQPQAAAPTQQPATPQAPMAPAPQRQASQVFDKGETTATHNNAPLAPRSVSAQMHAEDDAMAQDLASGHIEPKTYADLYNSKDTLGKIGTMFGLIAGGVGSGLTGQPNALLKMMDKTIDRDLDSQKTSASNRQNFYKIRQQQYLNQAQIRAQNAQSDTAELGNKVTRWGLQQGGINVDKNGKVGLSPAGERQVTAQAKMDMYTTAQHDLETKLSKMSPMGPNGQPNPVYAATAGALADITRNIASQKQNLTGEVEKAHTAEEDANDPIAKITGVSRSKVPAFNPVAPFLREDAKQTYQGLTAAGSASPALAAMTSGMKDQYTTAAQADKLLKALPAAYQDLYRLKSWTGRLSPLMANIGQAATTAIGAGIGAKSGNPMVGAMAGSEMPAGEIVKTLMSGSQQERLYGGQISKLAAMITTAVPALSGSAAGADEAKRWALQFAPVAGDDDGAVQYKMDQLVEKIKNAVPTNLIHKQMLN